MSQKYSGAAVLFDLDGTLVDTAEDLAAAMNHALARDRLGPVPTTAVRDLVGRGARRMLLRGYKIASDADPSDADLDVGLERLLAYYGDHIAVHSQPYDGVLDVIKDLRANGARIAICTNKREAMAVRLLRTLEIETLFDAIVGADTAAASKPDPAPVRLCLEKTKAHRAIFVGDSDTDIKAAAAVGMPCIIANFGYGPLTLLDRAYAAFNNYEEAANLIDAALTQS